MSKFKFTPEMFFKGLTEDGSEIACSEAQAALDKHLESLPKVYGMIKRNQVIGMFGEIQGACDIHTAVLFNLEPIKKKKCSHKVIFDSDVGYVCVHCEKTLKPIGGWEEVVDE